jgi:PilZ domain
MKPKHFERDVRRTRRLSAWIKTEGRALLECQVLDISQQGAKVSVETPPAVPDRFELAFSHGGQSRVCEVMWRRAKMLGVRFIF